MTKDQYITAMILAEHAKGKRIDVAFDAVLGEGAYKRLCHELYVELRARKNKDA